MPEEGNKSIFTKIVAVIKTLLLWFGALFIWLIYAFNNLDRSEQALNYTGGTGPVASGYSIAILGILLSILLRRLVFSKSISIKSVIAKALVLIVFAFGLYSQIDYDPSLAKLKAYRSPKPAFTGTELLSEVNSYRKGIGIQEIAPDETLCSNLVERWLAVKDPNNGHKGLEEWWADKKLASDPYGDINELYATAGSASRVIELWNESPGHKLALDNPKYNVGCTYAGEGTGVLIMAEHK